MLSHLPDTVFAIDCARTAFAVGLFVISSSALNFSILALTDSCIVDAIILSA